MEIRCKSSKRFLMEINIEEYFEALKKMGIEMKKPIKVTIPCAKCRMVEEFEIYPNTYKHIKSYKFNK